MKKKNQKKKATVFNRIKNFDNLILPSYSTRILNANDTDNTQMTRKKEINLKFVKN